MRKTVFAALAAVPVLLVAWVGYQGSHPPAPEKLPVASAPKAAAPGGDPALLALFQGALGGAKVKDKVALYDNKGLFDYIDGAAPVFIERGFRRLAAAEMSSADGADLVCDVYDMASPENATAIFQKEKSASAKAVDNWPAAIVGPMSFVFHAGQYYVKLTAFDAKSEAALPALAKALKDKAATPPISIAPAAAVPAPAPAPAVDEDAALRSLFDGALGGARVKDKVALYDNKGLFDYIDGAAPVFIERKFRKLGAAEMSFAGSDLVCDVYDMSTPEGATSMFEKERSASAKSVGGWSEAISGPMSFVFHTGRYYVKLTAFDAKAESALPALGRALKEKVK